MNDTVYDAGFEPEMFSNKHYCNAGRLHKAENYTQLKFSEIRPGCLLQLFGRESRDGSHNMVLTSFIERKKIPNSTYQLWKFTALGAEQEEAAESTHQYHIDPDASGPDYFKVENNITRNYIRFFKPNKERQS